MSYQDAINHFDLNVQELDPKTIGVQPDPTSVMFWNLNRGLSFLTENLANDLGQIRSLLDQILRELPQQRS